MPRVCFVEKRFWRLEYSPFCKSLKGAAYFCFTPRVHLSNSGDTLGASRYVCYCSSVRGVTLRLSHFVLNSAQRIRDWVSSSLRSTFVIAQCGSSHLSVCNYKMF